MKLFHGKLKFKIKNHRISTKIEFSGLKIDFIRKKNLEQFWSKFAPPKFRFIKYHRVPLLVMTILCKTKLLFVAAAVIIKNLLFTFLILISPYVWTNSFSPDPVILDLKLQLAPLQRNDRHVTVA